MPCLPRLSGSLGIAAALFCAAALLACGSGGGGGRAGGDGGDGGAGGRDLAGARDGASVVDVGAERDGGGVEDLGGGGDVRPAEDLGPWADLGPGIDGGAEPLCGLERVREDLVIPTLDGHTLSAFVDRPAREGCPLPTILAQTPYDKESAWRSFFGEERAQRPLFNSPHYNYVVVDWRGSHGSRGLPHPGDGAWMAQDSYDTVEWIAAQPWSDGKIGTWGVSALCGAQYRTAAGPVNNAAHPDFADGPPPHLVAMVPIMCPLRVSYGSVYPSGVLRHEYATTLDVLGFGLRRLYESNPRKNWIWDTLDGTLPAARMQVPALVIGGWWDLLPRATIEAFQELVQGSHSAVRERHRLLVGPWIHFATGGSVGEGAVRPLTEQEWDFMDTERVIDRDSLAWFDYHLRGIVNAVPGWSAVRYHHGNEGWAAADSWPPPEARSLTLYLTQEGLLAEAPPAAGSLALPYDPADPSPTTGGATLGPYNCVGAANPLVCSLTPDPDRILYHGPRSQAALLERPDHALFATAPLQEPLRLLGALRLHVAVATTGADTDVAVRVVDVDEQGDPWLIGEGIGRLSGRVDERSVTPCVAGERYELDVELLKDFAWTVPVGHRLGVIVSASHWPLFARNPADGAVFFRDDAHPDTDDTFSYGRPATVVQLKGDGQAVVNTVFLDGHTRLELQVAP